MKSLIVAAIVYSVAASSPTTSIETAFARHAREVAVEGSGTVTRILADDYDGDRHQRFLVRLDSGVTVLITHNIDIAPRVRGLRKGDRVAFAGQYVWNAKGGLIHWTHHDPHGRKKGGWIKLGAQTFR